MVSPAIAHSLLAIFMIFATEYCAANRTPFADLTVTPEACAIDTAPVPYLIRSMNVPTGKGTVLSFGMVNVRVELLAIPINDPASSNVNV